MDITVCSRRPMIHLFPTCSLEISRVSSLPAFSSWNPRGRQTVLPLLRISRSCTRCRAAGDATIDTTDYTGEISSNAFQSERAILHEKDLGDIKGIDDCETDSNYLTDDKMIKVCEKLIEVFMVDRPTPTDWRRLLVFSKEWENIRPHFFKHCHEKADLESSPEMKHKLFRLCRKLKEIDNDVQRHNGLINAIKMAPDEISSVVAKRRKDFTKEFFVHLHTVAESLYENAAEQNALAKIGNECLAAVQAYDSASESIQAVEAAELKFQDIINSPSLDAACRKIDDLAEKKELDSALMLMLTKAWSTAKESNMVKDEVKDVLYHLYKTAVGNMQRLVPKEIRIIKHLLTVEDPEELLSALQDAFTPGPELEGKDEDSLYTSPEQLHTWIRTVVDAYHFSREGSLIREARDLMNPKVIQKLDNLQKLVQDHFL